MIFVALVAGGCGNPSARSLVPIDIFAASDVGVIANVDVVIDHGLEPIITKRIKWDAPAGQPLKVGIYIAHSVYGSVDIGVNALDAGGNVIGVSDMGTVSIDPGKTAPLVTLHIMARTSTGGGDGGVTDGATDLEGGTPDEGLPSDGLPVDGGATMLDVAPGVDVPPGVDLTAPDAAPTGPAWGPTENIEPNDFVNRSYWATAAVDGKGNVLVGWTEDTQVKSRRWDAGSKTWGDTKVVGSQVNGAAPILKMSPDGHAVLAWLAEPGNPDDPTNGAYASQSIDGGLSWTPTKQVHSGYAFGDIDLRIAHDGSARATWTESVNNLYTVWAARYDVAMGAWTDVAAVKAGDDDNDRNPRLAMANNGDGLLVWRQNDATMHLSTWAAAFSAGQPFKTPQLLDTTTTDSIYDPVVAITPDGSKGIAAWSQGSNAGYDVYSAEYTVAGGWKAPTQAIVNSYFGSPVLVIDQTATATLVYYQPLTGGTANVVAARHADGQPWGQVTPLETANQAGLMIDQVPNASIGIAGNGDVHVAWNRKLAGSDDNTYSIVTRHWSMGAWQPEQTLFMKDKMHANDPGLGVGDNGQAALVFTYWDPTMAGDAMTYSTFASLFR
jgi:hypothetical protein